MFYDAEVINSSGDKLKSKMGEVTDLKVKQDPSGTIGPKSTWVIT